jgi:hypothetical protein
LQVQRDLSELELAKLIFLKARIAHDGYAVDQKTIVRSPIADGIRGLFLALVALDALQLTDEVRFSEEWQHKMYRILPFTFELLPSYAWPVRIDVLTPDQRRPGAKAVSAFHARLEAAALIAFGCPFYFPVFEAEHFAETRGRLREVLKLPDEEFGGLRFSIVYTYGMVAGEEIADDERVWRMVGTNSSLLVLHPSTEKSPEEKQRNKKKRAREQPIRIYN